MKMKKLFTTLFAAVGLALVGCGNKGPAGHTPKQAMQEFCNSFWDEEETGTYVAVEGEDYRAGDEVLEVENSWYTAANLGASLADAKYLVPALTQLVTPCVPSWLTVVVEPASTGSVGIAAWEDAAHTVSLQAQSYISQGALVVMVVALPWVDVLAE